MSSLMYDSVDGYVELEEGDTFSFKARSTSGSYKKTIKIIEIDGVEVTYYTMFEGNKIKNTTSHPQQTFGSLPLGKNP